MTYLTACSPPARPCPRGPSPWVPAQHLARSRLVLLSPPDAAGAYRLGLLARLARALAAAPLELGASLSRPLRVSFGGPLLGRLAVLGPARAAALLPALAARARRRPRARRGRVGAGSRGRRPGRAPDGDLGCQRQLCRGGLG